MTNNFAVLGLQWGDEGKGKIVNFLSDRANALTNPAKPKPILTIPIAKLKPPTLTPGILSTI